MEKIKKMFKLILMIMFMNCVNVFAQVYTISGVVVDKTGNSLPGAAVMLMKGPGNMVNSTVCDKYGAFSLKQSSGKYMLKITMIGQGEYKKFIEVTDKPLDLGKIEMVEKTTTLGEVVVAESVIPTSMKGDTTEIKAAAFKTNPDASAEDLVAKMPGVVNQNGKIQAQGEDVKQVMVDGKPFMGEDPNAVLRSLPAEVVEKIQVFDQKSEQAKFTGFDDGNTSKTINIITKSQFRNGTFGKVSAGHNEDDKYKAAGNINLFKDKRRISILGQSNNVNEQNFSSDDLLGVSSSSGGGGGRGHGGPGGRGGRGGGGQQGGDAGAFLVDQKNGITTTNAIGLNYSDDFGKKIKVSASYFFNDAKNVVNTDLFRDYISNRDKGLNYTENNNTTSRNINHRFNLRFDYQIDSSNSLLITPRLSTQQNNSDSKGIGSRLGYAMNTSQGSDLSGINFSSLFMYRHKFAKRGRTISLALTPSYNTNNGQSNQNSLYKYGVDSITNIEYNQKSDLDKVGQGISANLAYTEPIKENMQVMFNYNTSYNKNNSDKQTFNYSALQNNYSTLDSTYSNTFASEYLTQSLGTGYRYNKEKINFSAGADYQISQLKNEQRFPKPYSLDKTFGNILPNVMLQYRFTKQKNIRMFYRTNNNSPAIDQLQNVLNISNLQFLSIGNPDLKQDYQHLLNFRYSSTSPTKMTSFFVMLSGTYTDNYIGNNTTIASRDTITADGISLLRGTQLTRPENLSGYFNLRSFFNYSFPIKKIMSNINLNGGVTYSRIPAKVNNQASFSYNPSANIGLVLSSNISKNFDFTLSSTASYTVSENSLQPDLDAKYYNQTSRLKFQLQPWKGLVLQSDFVHQYYDGLSGNFDPNSIFWNAGIGYKFLKEKKAELRLIAYDVLNKNKSVVRNTSETYIEDVRYNTLSRYFMLTFTYNIKTIKELPKPDEHNHGGPDRGGWR